MPCYSLGETIEDWTEVWGFLGFIGVLEKLPKNKHRTKHGHLEAENRDLVCCG